MTQRHRDSRDYARRVAERWARETMRRQLVLAGQYLVLIVIAATVAVVWMA
jgi:hypothetical protein